MKILLSASACAPGLGSEEGVGWHWLMELSRQGHELWVLTRERSRPHIAAAERRGDVPQNVRFVYYDMPSYVEPLGKFEPGLHVYLTLWQWNAFRLARTLHERERFDLVHHLTYGNIRVPSFMGDLGIPFIFGPVGGGERSPMLLRKSFSLRGWMHEWLRDMGNMVVRYNPLVRATFRKAQRIHLRNSDCLYMVAPKFRQKVRIGLEIGCDTPMVAAPDTVLPIRPGPSTGLRALFVGRITSSKGVPLALHGFAAFLRRGGEGTLTIVGKGAELPRLQKMAQDLAIADKVIWAGHRPQAELGAYYRSHDVFLFPTLHDSGGSVVLEALGSGLPVVSLDLGGPAESVDDTCGVLIPTGGRDFRAVVTLIGRALLDLHTNPERLASLKRGTRARLNQLTWNAAVARVYGSAGSAAPGGTAPLPEHAAAETAPARVP